MLKPLLMLMTLVVFACAIADVHAQESFADREFTVKRQLYGIKYPWEMTRPYGDPVWPMMPGGYAPGSERGLLPELRRKSETPPKSFRKPVLDSTSMFGEAALAYKTAASCPDVLEHLFCYSGDDLSAGHKTLLDCFTGSHAMYEPVCQWEAVDAARLHAKGKNIDEIRAEIDKKYSRHYPYLEHTEARRQYEANKTASKNWSLAPESLALRSIYPAGFEELQRNPNLRILWINAVRRSPDLQFVLSKIDHDSFRQAPKIRPTKLTRQDVLKGQMLASFRDLQSSYLCYLSAVYANKTTDRSAVSNYEKLVEIAGKEAVWAAGLPEP